MPYEKLWKVTVAITIDMDIVYENGDDEQGMRNYFQTDAGKEFLLTEFIDNIKHRHFKKLGTDYVDVEVDEVQLKEYEVSKWDTDPRV